MLKQTPFLIRKIQGYAPILICVTFVVLSSILVLGNYQTANGDFGQYYIHSQNLLEGRPWSALIENYPAVLPGYPVLLAITSAIFGDSIFIVGLTNSVLWAITCFIACKLFQQYLKNPALKYLFLISCLFVPYVWSFQQEGQPNISYTFTFFAAALAAKNIVERKNTVLCIIIIMLASTVRADSLVIFVAIFIYFATDKSKNYLWVPVIGGLVTIGLDLLIAHKFGMKSNFSLGKSIANKVTLEENTNSLASLKNFISLYLHYIIGFLMEIPSLLLPHSFRMQEHFTVQAANGFKTTFNIFNVVVTSFFLAGFLNVKKMFASSGSEDSIFSFYRLLLMGHIAFISLFFLKAVAPRYLIPIVPIYLFYTFLGIDRVSTFLKFKTVITTSLMGIFISYIAYNSIKSDSSFPERKNFLFLPYTSDVADHVASIKEDRYVGFWKPRLMTVLLDKRNAATHKTVGVRRAHQAKKLFDENGLLVTYNGAVAKNLKSYLQENNDICITWKNERFFVYEKKNETTICIQNLKTQ